MTEDGSTERRAQLKLTRDIIAAYVSSNAIAPEALPSLITGLPYGGAKLCQAAL